MKLQVYFKKKKKRNLVLAEGQKFPTNQFVGNFIQPTYKSDMCHLNM
jgi:kynureninase